MCACNRAIAAAALNLSFLQHRHSSGDVCQEALSLEPSSLGLAAGRKLLDGQLTVGGTAAGLQVISRHRVGVKVRH